MPGTSATRRWHWNLSPGLTSPCPLLPLHLPPRAGFSPPDKPWFTFVQRMNGMEVGSLGPCRPALPEVGSSSVCPRPWQTRRGEAGGFLLPRAGCRWPLHHPPTALPFVRPSLSSACLALLEDRFGSIPRPLLISNEQVDGNFLVVPPQGVTFKWMMASCARDEGLRCLWRDDGPRGRCSRVHNPHSHPGRAFKALVLSLCYPVTSPWPGLLPASHTQYYSIPTAPVSWMPPPFALTDLSAWNSFCPPHSLLAGRGAPLQCPVNSELHREASPSPQKQLLLLCPHSPWYVPLYRLIFMEGNNLFMDAEP